MVVVGASGRAGGSDPVGGLVKIAPGVDERRVIAHRPRAARCKNERSRRLTRGIIQQFEPLLNFDHVVRRAIVERRRNRDFSRGRG